MIEFPSLECQTSPQEVQENVRSIVDAGGYEGTYECKVNECNELSLVHARGRGHGIIYAEIASRHRKT